MMKLNVIIRFQIIYKCLILFNFRNLSLIAKLLGVEIKLYVPDKNKKSNLRYPVINNYDKYICIGVKYNYYFLNGKINIQSYKKLLIYYCHLLVDTISFLRVLQNIFINLRRVQLIQSRRHISLIYRAELYD